MRTGNDDAGLWEISRDGEVWHLTLGGYTEADAVGGYLWPNGPLPAGVGITVVAVVTEPAQVGSFELTGLTPTALAAMEPWNAYWFTQLGGVTVVPGQVPPSALVDVLHIWFKSFIPDRTVDGPPLTDCFLGDNRGFSSDIGASARIHSEVTIEGLYTATPVMSQRHWCGESHQVSCDDGTVLQSATADTGGLTFYNFRYPGATVWDWDQPYPPAAHPPEVQVPDTAPISLDYAGSAAMPLLPSPAADIWAHISYDRTYHVLTIEGAVDSYPAYECYVSWYGGPGSGGPETALQVEPAGGPGSLVGAANRPFQWRIGLGPGSAG